MKPVLEIFTAPKDLGRVYREQNEINCKFTEFTLPLSTTTGNQMFNWKGKVRLIIIQGAHDGLNFAGADIDHQLADFVYEMEQWIQGGIANVQTTRVYTDSLGVSYNVYCVDWTWVRSFEDPNRILYNLILKEA